MSLSIPQFFANYYLISSSVRLLLVVRSQSSSYHSIDYNCGMMATCKHLKQSLSMSKSRANNAGDNCLHIKIAEDTIEFVAIL